MTRNVFSLLRALLVGAAIIGASLAPIPAAAQLTTLGAGRGGASGGAGTPFTFDPTVGTGATSQYATLANSNRDFTGSTNGFTTARALLNQTSGKACVEYTLTSVGGDGLSPQIGVGIAKSDFNSEDYMGDTAQSSASAAMAWLASAGPFATTITAANTSAQSGFAGNAHVNDLYMVCADWTAGKAWISKNGTFGASQDPAAGTNPWLTWTAGGTWRFGTSINASHTPQMRIAATGATPPSGFTLLNQ
jgi:hypothetical protein